MDSHSPHPCRSKARVPPPPVSGPNNNALSGPWRSSQRDDCWLNELVTRETPTAPYPSHDRHGAFFWPSGRRFKNLGRGQYNEIEVARCSSRSCFPNRYGILQLHADKSSRHHPRAIAGLLPKRCLCQTDLDDSLSVCLIRMQYRFHFRALNCETLSSVDAVPCEATPFIGQFSQIRHFTSRWRSRCALHATRLFAYRHFEQFFTSLGRMMLLASFFSHYWSTSDQVLRIAFRRCNEPGLLKK